MHPGTTFFKLANWTFGGIVALIGLINTFWGNDPGFGLFLLLLALLYFPPIANQLRLRVGISVHWVVKVGLGILILWAALGVGELFAKINLMRAG